MQRLSKNKNMFQLDVPYPEEIFPGTEYDTNENNAFGAKGNTRKIEYDEGFRDAGKYIEKYQTEGKNISDLDKYNFSVFRSNDNTSLKTMHQGYIEFFSDTVNRIMGYPKDTDAMVFINKKSKEKTGRELGLLATRIYPDGDYILSLNFEDIPIGFLGFNINKDGGIEIIQLQGGKVTDRGTSLFLQKHHLLDGFNWSKSIVHFFEDYLRNKGYKGKLILQSAENNAYYHKKKVKKDTLKKRYNDTAQDLGFTRNYRNWHLGNDFLDYSKAI